MMLARCAARAPGLLVLWLLIPAPALAGAPDVDGALDALVDAPLYVCGDLAGAAGLLAGGSVGLAADGVGLVDDNPVTGPVLRGAVSGVISRLALALSWTGTGMLEGLRAEDIERLPEPAELYLEGAPGLGHLDSILDGLGAGGLALEDALLHPPLLVARAVGWDSGADWIAMELEQSRTRVLGPLAES